MQLNLCCTATKCMHFLLRFCLIWSDGKMAFSWATAEKSIALLINVMFIDVQLGSFKRVFDLCDFTGSAFVLQCQNLVWPFHTYMHDYLLSSFQLIGFDLCLYGVSCLFLNWLSSGCMMYLHTGRCVDPWQSQPPYQNPNLHLFLPEIWSFR